MGPIPSSLRGLMICRHPLAATIILIAAFAASAFAQGEPVLIDFQGTPVGAVDPPEIIDPSGFRIFTPDKKRLQVREFNGVRALMPFNWKTTIVIEHQDQNPFDAVSVLVARSDTQVDFTTTFVAKYADGRSDSIARHWEASDPSGAFENLDFPKSWKGIVRLEIENPRAARIDDIALEITH